MSIFRSIITASLTLLSVGCTSDRQLEHTILNAFPKGVEIEIQVVCAPILGPAVALFSYEGTGSATIEEYQTPNGTWIRSNSLEKFAELSDRDLRGPGVGITILDGKKCLRELAENANDILFQPNPGLYFHSNDRQVVIILPEAQPGEGVLLVQAP